MKFYVPLRSVAVNCIEPEDDESDLFRNVGNSLSIYPATWIFINAAVRTWNLSGVSKCLYRLNNCQLLTKHSAQN